MTIVVTGATGNIGRPLIARLVAAVAEALPGACAVFLNSRALGDRMEDVIGWCGSAGITKLVALVAINVDDDDTLQPSRFRGDRNKEVEQLAEGSGLAWTSLRPSVFASNFAGMWSAQLRAGDVVTGPYAGASLAPIDDRDVAAVAAHALLTDELVGQKLSLTGPQALTNAELVEVVGAVLRRPVQYRELPPDVARERFSDLGFAAEFGDAYIAMLAQTLDKPALVTHEVEKILGRPPLTFAQWTSTHREAFTAVACDA